MTGDDVVESWTIGLKYSYDSMTIGLVEASPQQRDERTAERRVNAERWNIKRAAE